VVAARELVSRRGKQAGPKGRPENAIYFLTPVKAP